MPALPFQWEGDDRLKYRFQNFQHPTTPLWRSATLLQGEYTSSEPADSGGGQVIKCIMRARFNVQPWVTEPILDLSSLCWRGSRCCPWSTNTEFDVAQKGKGTGANGAKLCGNA